jgi:hypothetical protein
LKIVKLQDEGVFGSYHIFAITSSVKNFDDALRDALLPLQLDIQGKLVERLSLQGKHDLSQRPLGIFLNLVLRLTSAIFAKFESAWRDFQADGIEMLIEYNCKN